MTHPCARLVQNLEPDLVRCPYPLYAEMRSAPPVWVEEAQAFVCTRYADIRDVGSDQETFSSAMARGPVSIQQMAEVLIAIAEEDPSFQPKLMGMADLIRYMLITSDPPLHAPRRALVAKAFTPKRIRSMEPMMRSLAEALIDDFGGREGEVDFVAAFAIPLPVRIIAEAMGVGDGDLEDFRRWSVAFMAPLGQQNPSKEVMRGFIEAYDEFARFFGEKLDARAERPIDDVLQDLIRAGDDGDVLERAEAVVMLTEILQAGNVSTTILLTNIARALASQPHAMVRLREAPDLIPAFVEEVLRMEAPAQAVYRMAKRDTVVGGVEVKEGQHVLLFYGAANHDPKQFPEPETMDLERDELKTHLTFGRGPHACLGSLLARTEGRIVTEVLVSRFEHLELAVVPDEVPFLDSYIAHGPSTLPIRYRLTESVPALNM